MKRRKKVIAALLVAIMVLSNGMLTFASETSKEPANAENSGVTVQPRATTTQLYTGNVDAAGVSGTFTVPRMSRVQILFAGIPSSGTSQNMTFEYRTGNNRGSTTLISNRNAKYYDLNGGRAIPGGTYTYNLSSNGVTCNCTAYVVILD